MICRIPLNGLQNYSTTAASVCLSVTAAFQTCIVWKLTVKCYRYDLDRLLLQNIMKKHHSAHSDMILKQLSFHTINGKQFMSERGFSNSYIL